MATFPLLDVAAMAEQLGVSQRHIRQLVADRRIPYVKIGRALRFNPADIEAWLDANRQEAMPPAETAP